MMKKIRRITALMLTLLMLFAATGCDFDPDDLTRGAKRGGAKEERSEKREDPNDPGQFELTKTSSSEAPDMNKLTSEYENAEKFRSGLTKFNYKLMSECYQGDTIMISPVSAYAALAMLGNGAAGQTLSEMEAMFGCDMEEIRKSIQYLMLRSEQADVVRIANSVWMNSGIDFKVKEQFLDQCTEYFRSAVLKAPFTDRATVDAMNAWVRKNTKERIDKVIDSLTNDQVMVLMNAITFDGIWEDEFDEERTISDYDFIRADGSTKKVEMMNGEADRYFENEYMVGVEKYYKNGYVFRAYLPKEGTDIRTLLTKLSELTDVPYMRADEIHFRLPKFEERSTVPLNDALKALGLKSAFTAGADFSKMTDTEVCVSSVLQKTYIKMYEKGTEAAAVTVITVDTCSVDMEKVIRSVTLDHPFVYEIVDTKADVPLFIGIYE